MQNWNLSCSSSLHACMHGGHERRRERKKRLFQVQQQLQLLVCIGQLQLNISLLLLLLPRHLHHSVHEMLAASGCAAAAIAGTWLGSYYSS